MRKDESPAFEIRMRRLRRRMLHFTHFIWLPSGFVPYFFHFFLSSFRIAAADLTNFVFDIGAVIAIVWVSLWV